MKSDKQVVSINLGFENCDFVEITIDYVYQFNFKEVAKICSYDPHGQGFSSYKTISELYIEFTEPFETFQADLISSNVANNVKERIHKFKDVCWFGIKWDDSSEDSYRIEWKGGDQYKNHSQDSREAEVGYGFILEISGK